MGETNEQVPATETSDDVLLMIQNKLKVPKSERNEYGGYAYRTIEAINQAVKPIAALMESYVIYTDEIVQVGDRYYVKATCKLVTPYGEIHATSYAREAESRKGMDASQITGAASSYARKYAAQGLFALDGDDADALPPAPESKWPDGRFNVRCHTCNNLGRGFTAQQAESEPCVECGRVDWVLA